MMNILKKYHPQVEGEIIMQATIRIEKTLREEVVSLVGLATQKVTVEEALRQLITLSRQKHVRTLRGKL